MYGGPEGRDSPNVLCDNPDVLRDNPNVRRSTIPTFDMTIPTFYATMRQCQGIQRSTWQSPLSFIAVTQRFSHPINFEVWSYFYLSYAKKPQPFYPPEFKAAADAVLWQNFQITCQHITYDTCDNIYNHLITIMTWCIICDGNNIYY